MPKKKLLNGWLFGRRFRRIRVPCHADGLHLVVIRDVDEERHLRDDPLMRRRVHAFARVGTPRLSLVALCGGADHLRIVARALVGIGAAGLPKPAVPRVVLETVAREIPVVVRGDVDGSDRRFSYVEAMSVWWRRTEG